MKIQLTKEESEKIFFDAMCNGLSYLSGYGIQLVYSKEAYQLSKKTLSHQNKGTCFEEVLMEMLCQGSEITFVDLECDGEYTRTVTLNDVHERVQLAPASRLIEMVDGEDDADTADIILQSVLYGEVIFG